MPEFATEAQLIRGRFKDLIIDAGLHSGSPAFLVLWENQEPASPSPDANHVRLSVLSTDSRQASTGNRRLFRNVGIFNIDILTVLDQGEGVNEAIADIIEPHFRADREGAVLFKVPRYEKLGPRNPWFLGRLSCPYDADFSE